MATITQLTTELTNLISQTKRRNVDLKSAAEKTLGLLRAYPTGSDESKFLRGLSKSQELIKPFIIACSTRNAKYCASAVQCLHILLAGRAVPIDQLPEVVDALDEATHLGVEIQLKILQTLPLFIQSYGRHIHGPLLVNLLQVCYSLQTGNKISVVINTAAATLQQIIVSLFDRVVEEDQSKPTEDEQSTNVNVQIDGNQQTSVRKCAYDALIIFVDLCNLAERQPTKFLKFSHLQESFTLELLESILTNHSSMFVSHVELGFILRTRVVPLLLRAFSENRSFDITVRVTRILYLLVRREMPALQVECEVIVSLLTHMLSSDDEPVWKQILCLEVFQGIFNDFDLVLLLFKQYDNDSTKRPIVTGIIETLSKVIEKNSSKIGVSPNTVPHIIPSSHQLESDHPDKDSAIYNTTLGITTELSTVRVPCIDLLDKAEAPSFPDTYMSYLVLDCLNYLSDGLAKTLLNITHSADNFDASEEKPKKRSPLMLPDGEKSKALRCFIDACWVPIFESYKVLFLVSMDLETCHSLIRSSQRFCHSSGVLKASDPRDTFLRLLGKFAIYGISNVNIQSSSKNGTNENSNGTRFLGMDSIVGSLGKNTAIQTPASGNSEPHRTPSVNETGNASYSGLSQRNILCCRALLNLAVALGPVLDHSWLTIVECLQCFDSLVNRGADRVLLFGDFPFFSRNRPELSIIDASVKKVLESTRELDDKAFFSLLKAICQVSCYTMVLEPIEEVKLPEVSNFALGNDVTREDPNFLLCLLGELTALNIRRFALPKDNDLNIWHFMGRYFLTIIESEKVLSEPKIIASTILNNTIVLTVVECGNLQRPGGNFSDDCIQLSVKTQKEVINTLYLEICGNYTSSAVDILVSSLDTLKTILDQSGSRLGNSWDVVFSIISTVFKYDKEKGDGARLRPQDIARLIRSGFESMQLICNDFLDNLPKDCMCRLIETLYNFCEQINDLNISFTSISDFWLISDHLRGALSDSRLDLPQPFTSAKEIEAAVETTGNSDSFTDKELCLWLIVLLRLTAIVSDNRPQVRNGAVVTLFRIFETYGHHMPANIWQTCHNVVLPRIMSSKYDGEVTTEFVETISLILEGFSTIYSMFLPNFIRTSPDFCKVWHKLLEYCRSLISIEHSDISIGVYSCILTILNGLKSNLGFVKLPSECLDELWTFWISQKLPTYVADAKSTQECLKTLVNIYSPLREISVPGISWENTKGSILLLGRCASFNLLAPFYSDRERTSPLQGAALAQLKLVDIDSVEVLSLLIRTVSDLCVLCIAEENDKGEVVCHEANCKHPTFIELSYESMLYLESKLLPLLVSNEYFKDLLYDDNRTVEYVMRKITFSSLTKYSCPWVTQSGSNPCRQLWEIAYVIFLGIIRKAVVIFTEDSPAPLEFTNLTLGGVESMLSYNGLGDLEARPSGAELSNTFEVSDIEVYKEFIGIIDPELHPGVFSNEFWDRLIQILFKFSVLNGISVDLDFSDISATTKNVISSPRFGTIRKLSALPRRSVAYHCFGELFHLSLSKDSMVKSKSSQYLTLRGAIILRYYLVNRPLMGKAPMPILQREELQYFFQELLKFEKENKGFNIDLALLQPILIECIPLASHDHDFLRLIESLLLCFNHKYT